MEPRKLWHDDIRQPPEHWFWVRTNREAQIALLLGEWDEISMDHDLGLDHIDPTVYEQRPEELWVLKGGGKETGLDLVRWMIENDKVPPKVTVHSWNPDGAKRMRDLLNDHGHDVIVAPFHPSYSW